MPFFLKIFPSGPLETNAILFASLKTQEAVVIDPALGSTEKILREAKEKGFTLQKILLTHSHWDHIAEAAEISKKTGAPLYVHASDAENVRRPGSDHLPCPLSIQGVEQVHLLQEGERIPIGELTLEVIHTPGHSPGGVAFWEKTEGLLFSGDTLFRGTMGALHLPTAEPEKMGPTLRKLANLPPATRVIPGHGGETTIGREQHWMEVYDADW